MWAALLHQWGQDNEAWALLYAQIPEPTFPSFLPKAPREQMEFLWKHNPGDIVNARNLAHTLSAGGDEEKSDAVILGVASKPDAPQWFLNKAAHIVARQKHYAEAVEFALRAK
jgi:hypothetical protein